MSQPSESAKVALVKMETNVSYEPFGSKDIIKLSVSIVQNLVAVKTKSGKTCSERDAIKFLAMCQAKRMNPFEGDCFLIGYDNRDKPDEPNFALVTAHQTYLKRAELHPEFDGMKSGIIVREKNGKLSDLEGDFYEDDQTVVGGWATVMFKTRKQPMHKRLRLARFKKSFGLWLEDAAGMICKCAEADSLRSSFPTMLGGLYMREELENPLQDQPKEPSKPLFTSPEPKKLEEPPPVIEEPPAEPESPDHKLRIGLLEKLNKVGLSEVDLMHFLEEIGSVSEGVLYQDCDPNILRMVDAQFDDMAKRIKSTGAA